MKAKAFDISNLDTITACNKPFELEIEHPQTKEKTGVFISVLGKDSDVYRAKVKAMANENMQRNAVLSQRGKTDIPSIDKMESKNIDALVAATVSWREMVMDGETLDCTPENVRKVYTRILPIREQVQEAINDLENFMQD